VGFERSNGSAGIVYSRLRSNQIPNIIDGFDDGSTPNLLVNRGINNPDKPDAIPYAGAPDDTPVVVVTTEIVLGESELTEGHLIFFPPKY
jgi:hypothetical protein